MTGTWRAIHLDEPKLMFGHDQTADHPKDGLFLFGPVDSNQNPVRMDVGVIATISALGSARLHSPKAFWEIVLAVPKTFGAIPLILLLSGRRSWLPHSRSRPCGGPPS